MFRQQHIADPRHKRPSWALAAFFRRRNHTGEEGRNLFLGRLIALEDVDPLGHKRRAAEGLYLMELVRNVDLDLTVVAGHLGAAGDLGINNLRESMEHKAHGVPWSASHAFTSLAARRHGARVALLDCEFLGDNLLAASLLGSMATS